jgi:hypothetical protein
MVNLRLGKSFLHGKDKDGRPICLVRVRLHRHGEQTEASMERFTVYTIETARMLLAQPVDTAAIPFDMTDFSLANMDYPPVKFMIKCLEAHYPESLGVCLVHKAPWIFQGIWAIIKGWLDPVVASKVHFTRSVEDLEEYIPRGQILKELGGDEDWEYKYVGPADAEKENAIDTTARDKLLSLREDYAKEFERLTLQWTAAVAEGNASSESATELHAKRDACAEKLRENYWELDPFVRARSVYDRTGVIGAGGVINFYPSNKGTSPTIPESSNKVQAVDTHADDLD